MFSRIFTRAQFAFYLARLGIARRFGWAPPEIPPALYYRLPESAQDEWGEKYMASVKLERVLRSVNRAQNNLSR